MPAKDIGHFDTVYDLASLTALPENIRGRYVEQLSRLVPKSAKILLLTIEDAAEDATMAQANGIDAEIASLFTSKFDIDLAYVENVFELDPESPQLPAKRAEYKVYRLCAR
ncbi:MAG: hypothetical protein PHY62_08900 [Gallionella sp.]|nr:hypothetical protein [Gallionella sp.]